MKRLPLLASLCLIILLGLAVTPHTATVFASTQSDICNGIGGTGAGSCSSGPSLGSIIRNVIDIFSSIVGIVSVIMVIVGGFQYVTAQGDSGKISGAKNTIIYALVGLVIVALSQAIVQLVLNKIGISK